MEHLCPQRRRLCAIGTGEIGGPQRCSRKNWLLSRPGCPSALAVRLERMPDFGGSFSQKRAVPHCQRKLGVTANGQAPGSVVAVEPNRDTALRGCRPRVTVQLLMEAGFD